MKDLGVYQKDWRVLCESEASSVRVFSRAVTGAYTCMTGSRHTARAMLPREQLPREDAGSRVRRLLTVIQASVTAVGDVRGGQHLNTLEGGKKRSSHD